MLGVLCDAAAADLPAEIVRYADRVFFNGKGMAVDKDFTVAQVVAAQIDGLKAVLTMVGGTIVYENKLR